MATLRAIGLMSGTSLDGIDVALIETDGERLSAFGPSALYLYQEHERALLRRAVEDAQSLTERGARPGALAAAEAMVTTRHQAAVRAFLDANGIDAVSVDVVGFHGQTVLHRPERQLTVQIGDGGELARRLGIAVVYDFRAADVAAGGQGAPLVPVFHGALARRLDRPHPLAVLNVGGVANVTWLDGEGDPVACDTGPGNALIDDLMASRTGVGQDTDGKAAAAGRVDEALLRRLMDHPFFARRPPKSLDRNDFRAFVATQSALERFPAKCEPVRHRKRDQTVASRVASDSIGMETALQGMRTEDAAATLTAFTAAAVAAVVPMLPRPPRTWIVAGGGARNPSLLRLLTERLAPATVETADAVRWSADALEAQAFAYLAARMLNDLPITFPGTTGVPQPLRGGVLARP